LQPMTIDEMKVNIFYKGVVKWKILTKQQRSMMSRPN